MTDKLLIPLLLACLFFGTNVNAEGYLAVVNKGDNNVSIVNLATGAVVKFPVGNMPHEVTASSQYIYVANYGNNHIRSISTKDVSGNTISIISPKKEDPVREMSLGVGQPCAPHGIFFSEHPPRLYVTCEARYEIAVFDLSDNKLIHTIPTNQPGSHMLVVDSKQKYAYSANFWIGTVSVVDLESKTVVRNVRIGRGIEGIDIDSNDEYLYLTNVESHEISKLNLKSLEIEKTLFVGDRRAPIRIVLGKDDKYLFVNNSGDGTLGVYSNDPFEHLKDISVGSLPIGLTSSTDGEFVYVANMRDNSISVIDGLNHKLIETIKLDSRLPDGIIYLEDFELETDQ